MTINTSALSSTLQSRVDALDAATETKEVLLLSKALEAAAGSTSVSDVLSEGVVQVNNVNSEGAAQIANVQATGAAKVTEVNSAGASQVTAVQGVLGNYTPTSGFKTVGGTSVVGSGDIANDKRLVQTSIGTSTSTYMVGAGTGWENVGLSATLTPSSSASKFLIMWHTPIMVNPSTNLNKIQARLTRGGTEFWRLGDHYCDEDSQWRTYNESGSLIYAPGVTGSQTIALQFSTETAGTDSNVRINEYSGTGWIQVTEIN